MSHILFPAPLVDNAIGASICPRPIFGSARPFALVSIPVGEVDNTGLRADISAGKIFASWSELETHLNFLAELKRYRMNLVLLSTLGDIGVRLSSFFCIDALPKVLISADKQVEKTLNSHRNSLLNQKSFKTVFMHVP